jgi:hypothetical protein
MKNAKTLAMAALLWAAIGTESKATITISTQPADATVATGAKLEFYVSATTSTTNAITYQWYKRVGKGTPTASATTPTNTIASAASGDEASYWVVMTDVTSTNTSATNKAIVVAAPTISTQPINKNIGLGSNYVVTVGCSNRLGSYSWLFNRTNALSGNNTNRYTITGAQFTDAGTYSLVLSNIAGSVTSTPALISVLKYPTITNQITVSNVVPAGVNVTNRIGVDGTGLYYQWYKGKVAAASTSNTFILTAVTTANNGTYNVVVTNAIGKVTSGNWVLTVIPPPTITTQPKSTGLTNGQKLALTVKATGTKPCTNLLYQWTLNATNVLAGATNATFVVTNAASSNAGSYTVVITNFGGSVTSTPVTVTVGNDTLPPTLKITDPAKTNSACTNATYTFKGTAIDNVSVTNVAYSLDGSHFTNSATTTNAWAKWSADVPVAIGSNTVWLMAQDYSGLATTNKVQLFYAKWYSLTISNAGSGGVTLTGPSNAVQYGSNYTLTAKTAAHTVFTKWVNWSGITISTNGTTNTWKNTTNVIKFIATNNATITVEANTNRFWTSAGTYIGLMEPSISMPLGGGVILTNYDHTNVGYASITVDSNLLYSAKLTLGAKVTTASGQFDTNGETYIPMPGNSRLYCEILQPGGLNLYCLYLDSNTNDTALGYLHPPHFSKTNPAVGLAGTYTMALLPPKNNTNAYERETIGGDTNGCGYATFTISSNGAVSVAGLTADGQVFAQSTYMETYYTWPLCAQLYSYNKTNYGGQILGHIYVRTNALGTYFEASLGGAHGLLWVKAVNPSGITNYPNGFTNLVGFAGSTFKAPTSDNPCVLTNFVLGSIAFNGGGQTNNFSAYIFQDMDGSFYSYTPNISLKISKTGILSGKFPLNNADTKKLTSFSGVAIQSSNTAFGSFVGPSGTGTVQISPVDLSQ